MNVQPVTLAGRYARLVPLDRGHLRDLCTIGLDPVLWRWSVDQVTTPAAMATYVDEALALAERGQALPFAILDAETGEVVGTTRMAAIDRQHRRLEIGWTWLTPRRQRTPINTEAKLLLMTHAFETLGCLRVEFKTDALNDKSRAALGRIGAKEEGIFRNHMVTSTGRVRHTVYFSVIAEEWPAVKASLRAKLQ